MVHIAGWCTATTGAEAEQGGWDGWGQSEDAGGGVHTTPCTFIPSASPPVEKSVNLNLTTENFPLGQSEAVVKGIIQLLDNLRRHVINLMISWIRILSNAVSLNPRIWMRYKFSALARADSKVSSISESINVYRLVCLQMKCFHCYGMVPKKNKPINQSCEMSNFLHG